MANKQFTSDLTKWADLVGVLLDALARQSIQSLVENVKHDTPFDTGNLRGQWQPSINSPPPDNQPSPGASESAISLAIAQLKAGDTYYQYNNAAYALRMEYGFVGEDSLGRKYNQPGRFFVQGAIARWPQIVTQAAADLSGRLG